MENRKEGIPSAMRRLTGWQASVWVALFSLLGFLAGMAAPIFFEVADKIFPWIVREGALSTVGHLSRVTAASFLGLGLPICVAMLLGGYSMVRLFCIETAIRVRKIAGSACALLLAYPAAFFLCVGFSSATLAIDTAFSRETDFYAWRVSPFETQLGDTFGFLFVLFSLTVVILLCARAIEVATGRLPRHALPVAISLASVFMLLVPEVVIIRDILRPRHYTVSLSPPASYGMFELALAILQPYVWWVTNTVLGGLVGYWFLRGVESHGGAAEAKLKNGK